MTTCGSSGVDQTSLGRKTMFESVWLSVQTPQQCRVSARGAEIQTLGGYAAGQRRKQKRLTEFPTRVTKLTSSLSNVYRSSNSSSSSSTTSNNTIINQFQNGSRPTKGRSNRLTNGDDFSHDSFLGLVVVVVVESSSSIV